MPSPIKVLAALSLILPAVGSTSIAASPTSMPHLYLAQYEGPYGAPGEEMGPYDGGDYGPEPGMRRSRSTRSAGAVSYHGFRIDLSSGDADELAAVEHQIDIVDSAGLPASDLALFRSKAIKVSGAGGRNHSNRGTSVVMGDLQAAQSRPVLLHEYMHMLHRARMPGGFNNPTIRRFYEEALANNLYPQGSYVMSNVREFFAVTASCFLYGSVERPPYSRDAIRQAQPDYYAYLAHLFGHG